MAFVKNAWYVAGWSSEFDQQFRCVTVLDENLLMFRKQDGTVVALEDRCPHRQLPLSLGKRIDDTVQCGYHGMTFNAAGECIRIPGQDRIPATACVRPYRIIEKNHIVFVWMGDAETADESSLFELPQLDAAGWHAHQGDLLHIQANYQSVAENLVDPAHVSFVHPTTLGNAASEDVAVDVDTSGDVLAAWRWIRDAPPVGFFREFGGFTGHVDRWHYYYLHLPSIAVIDFGSAGTERALAEADRDDGMRIFALHFLTPVNEHYTIDRWMHVRNVALDDESASEKMDALFRIAFDEDKTILEAIEARERQERELSVTEGRPLRKPLRLAIDRAPTVYRQRIASSIKQEQEQVANSAAATT